MAADWTPVEPISSVHWCPVPLENGVTMTCGAGGENSRQTAVAIANARAYTFSQGVSVGVRSLCVQPSCSSFLFVPKKVHQQQEQQTEDRTP